MSSIYCNLHFCMLLPLTFNLRFIPVSRLNTNLHFSQLKELLFHIHHMRVNLLKHYQLQPLLLTLKLTVPVSRSNKRFRSISGILLTITVSYFTCSQIFINALMIIHRCVAIYGLGRTPTDLGSKVKVKIEV